MDAEQMYFCLESWCASLRFLENRLEACFQIWVCYLIIMRGVKG